MDIMNEIEEWQQDVEIAEHNVMIAKLSYEDRLEDLKKAKFKLAMATWKEPKNLRKLLSKLRMSKHNKEKMGWSRNIGCGFVSDDIEMMMLDGKAIQFKFTWGSQTIKVPDLNLRETDEAILFIEKQTVKVKDI